MPTTWPRATLITHSQLLDFIRTECYQRQLWAQYFPDSRTSWSRGWPDLVVCGPGGFEAWELKTEYDSLRPEQRQWGAVLHLAGVTWKVIRPRDLHSGVVGRRLDDLALSARAPAT